MNQQRGFAAIGLYQPKHSANIGSVFRAMGCFDASLLVTCGQRFKPGATDTMKTHRHVPWIHTEDLWMAIPYNTVPVAVELCDNASPLLTYQHPERAFYIFGPEDGSVPKFMQDRCRDRVFITSNRCLNLAAAVNIVLYDRAVKSFKRG